MKSLKNNFFLIKIVWSAAPSRILWELASMVLSYGLSIAYDLFFMRFLIECLQREVSFPRVAAVVAGYFLLSILMRVVVVYKDQCVSYRTNVQIQEKLMDIVYRQALRVDLDCYEDSEFYDSYTRANEEITTRTEEILYTMNEALGIMLSLIVYGAAVLIYDPLIIPILLAAVLVSRGIQSKYIKYVVKRQNEAVHQRRRMDYAKRIVYLQEYAKDLRLTNIFAPVMRNFHNAAREARELSGYYGKKAGIFRILSTLVSSLSVAFGLNAFILFRYLIAHAYGLGIMTTIMNASNGLNDCLGGLVRISGTIQRNGKFIANYRRFVEYEPAMKEKENAKEAVWGSHNLELSHVSFSYKGSDKKVLSDINLSIPAGQKIALVGHNGAGKSTLVKLLMRLYDPTEGEVKLDGIDARDYTFESYRGQFGTIFQDFKIFAASVTENVLLEKPSGEADVERARQALRDSGVWDKIKRLPQGVDSMMTKEFEEDGVLMSGGEQQKLAVARVFARESSIAILDEPSSALDPISEYELFDNMMKACAGKTVIFVSHRLSSATLADKVYLLEQGRIIEQGSHEELLAMKGKYARMFKMQAENYQNA